MPDQFYTLCDDKYALKFSMRDLAGGFAGELQNRKPVYLLVYYSYRFCLAKFRTSRFCLRFPGIITLSRLHFQILIMAQSTICKTGLSRLINDFCYIGYFGFTNIACRFSLVFSFLFNRCEQHVKDPGKPGYKNYC